MPASGSGWAPPPGTGGGTSPFGIGSQAIDLTRLIDAAQQTTQAINGLNKTLTAGLAGLVILLPGP